jgi:hypothetical protein
MSIRLSPKAFHPIRNRSGDDHARGGPCRIRLRNPTLLASGVMGETGDSLLRVARRGRRARHQVHRAGAPQGLPEPHAGRAAGRLHQRHGPPGPGIEAFAEEMETREGTCRSSAACSPRSPRTSPPSPADGGLRCSGGRTEPQLPARRAMGWRWASTPTRWERSFSSVKGAVRIR